MNQLAQSISPQAPNAENAKQLNEIVENLK